MDQATGAGTVIPLPLSETAKRRVRRNKQRQAENDAAAGMWISSRQLREMFAATEEAAYMAAAARHGETMPPRISLVKC